MGNILNVPSMLSSYRAIDAEPTSRKPERKQGSLTLRIQTDKLYCYSATLVNLVDDEEAALCEMQLTMPDTIDDDILSDLVEDAETSSEEAMTLLLVDDTKQQAIPKTQYRFIPAIKGISASTFAKLFKDSGYLVHDDFRLVTFF